MENIINIGIPSKGRLRKDVLKIFKKKKLNLISERGERDLIGSITKLSNSSEVSQKIVSYMNFLLSKERAGIERAADRSRRDS